MKTLAVIPARYASTRFPGKPLAKIGGKEMLRHVYERVKESGLFTDVLIATEDRRILDAVLEWEAPAVMTSEAHATGTERVAEAVLQYAAPLDVVVNVQGDEPFIRKEPLEALLRLFENPSVEIGTLVRRVTQPDDLFNPNVAKVAVSELKRALYFSRSPIPFVRDMDRENWLAGHTFWRHIGIYAFRPDVLGELVKLPPALLEEAEKLEQLRWLAAGRTISVAKTEYESIAVDTPQDLEEAERFWQKHRG